MTPARTRTTSTKAATVPYPPPPPGADRPRPDAPPPVPPPDAEGTAESARDAPPPPPHDDEDPRRGGLAPEVEVPDLDARERRLAPKVVTSWRLTAGFAAGLPLAIVTAVAFGVFGAYGWVAFAVAVAVLAVVVGWYPRARYRRWHWRLTELALELSYGVVVHQYEAVPYFRIQQIDIVQGPVDRLLGLATLQVTTASSSGNATLGGLADGDAPGIRAALLERAAQAVGEHPGDLRDAV